MLLEDDESTIRLCDRRQRISPTFSVLNTISYLADLQFVAELELGAFHQRLLLTATEFHRAAIACALLSPVGGAKARTSSYEMRITRQL